MAKKTLTNKQILGLKQLVSVFHAGDETYYVDFFADGDNGWMPQWRMWNKATETWKAVDESRVPRCVLEDHSPY